MSIACGSLSLAKFVSDKCFLVFGTSRVLDGLTKRMLQDVISRNSHVCSATIVVSFILEPLAITPRHKITDDDVVWLCKIVFHIFIYLYNASICMHASMHAYAYAYELHMHAYAYAYAYAYTSIHPSIHGDVTTSSSVAWWRLNDRCVQFSITRWMNRPISLYSTALFRNTRTWLRFAFWKEDTVADELWTCY